MPKTKFHLWFPNIFEFKGGIQTYSAFLLQAIQNIYPDANYGVFLMHDRRSSANFTNKNITQFHCAGIVPLVLRTPLFATQLMAWGVTQRPNLVIASHLNFTVIANKLNRFAGIPYWTIAHGVEAWDLKNAEVKKSLHHADQILAVSHYTRDRIIEKHRLNPDKVSILPNTFASSRFKPAPKPNYLLRKYQLKPEQQIILTVARLAEAQRYKGYDQILQALPHIRQLIPNVHYVIVGKGNDKHRIESMIVQQGLQNCVTLAGFVPDEQLCDYYNLCDVFAMPSKREGFGIVYLEALACGKPVLGGNQDGANDALCHGELGALVDPDNVEEIALTLIQILQGIYPNQLMYQPDALRQKVIDYFGFERFQATLAKYLDKRLQSIK
ncbi:glycosyltransferase [Anabaena sp. FACHB-709]|uniref:Glycosyltransferase n=2 Tax=Nostocaceae TaxID=1162 RepID=A0A1Z4KPG7_ANAVA|nr:MULTISPECIES: glycosyltransferase [Nostocaceae]BAY70837.1 glycosyltransferase [Trichormus variabilis NIES-23]HBW31048.1 glycosyltransferase family 4 protein [Nostoc sp. UBA8866]MBD2171241.1 glycosyltransferase [Anabaena cylindrica FACHB-318]MBD2263089.1 glycosyltransferase [Anabaena sp. FACHB-709]MBD2272568.1 glycosyltransferase [Nostoc sp. PCC 7120 = FACHB-418]